MTGLGEWGGAAKALIEKVSDAIGGYSKPWQIKRVAKAEVESEIIKMHGKIEVEDVRRQAIARFVAEEAKRQNNIEEITRKAIPHLKDASSPQKIEDDWIVNFFDKCRIVSDEEMQSLWAKVLAGEANQPGTFSKRTVNFVGSLDKAEAQLFTVLCGFCWMAGDLMPLVFDEAEDIYKSCGINFGSLTHLDDIGLISFEPLAGFLKTGFLKSCVIYYYGKAVRVEFINEKDNQLMTGKVLLTRTGKQLASICGSKPVDGFVEYVVEKWSKEGFLLSSPYPQKSQPKAPAK